jgi:hypothetical protein
METLMDKLHVIHSRNGKIGPDTDTTAEDLDALVAAAAQHPSRHLILHFHGGLVDKLDGLATAQALTGAYESGGYPVFFVWESGWWEAIRNNLAELRNETAVRGLERKILFWVAGKLGLPMPGGNAAFLDMNGIDIAQRAAEARNELDANEVEADMKADPEFRLALSTLPGLSDSDRAELGVNAFVESHTAVAETLSRQLHGEGFVPAGGGFLWRTARYVVQVAWHVFERFHARRDHGLHATCMEELVRALKVGGSTMADWGRVLEWESMKKDTRDAFEKTDELSAAPELHAATALLMRLRDAIAEERMHLDRITLVGHSAGAVYIANWLRHCGDYLPAALKHDLVFLAPAISYDDFADLLATHKDKIGKFRMFAMKDELERVDQVIGNDMENEQGAARIIYPSSLLYLVSGILETRTSPSGIAVDEPDKPLLGLQRFYKNTQVYNDADFPAIKQVVGWLDSANHTVVWSVSAGQADGLNCPCNDHGSFGGHYMADTLRHIVTAGF